MGKMSQKAFQINQISVSGINRAQEILHLVLLYKVEYCEYKTSITPPNFPWPSYWHGFKHIAMQLHMNQHYRFDMTIFNFSPRKTT